MNTFKLVPEIVSFDSCNEFVESFNIGKKDLILTNLPNFDSYFKAGANGLNVIFMSDYGKGEPTDMMVEEIYKATQEFEFNRMIAIGGGSVIDVSKILSLKNISPVEVLFDKELPVIKDKELIIVPTTCGTGSEVTSVSVLEIINKKTKLGLQHDELYADCAVLIPELIENLPDYVFATSSIDALIHATESYLSPRATDFSMTFSMEAIKRIISGYQELRNQTKSYRELTSDFLTASTYAGVAFGNAGCAAVHAMSMSFSSSYHVPHGESNYILFTEVMKTYEKLKPEGRLKTLKEELAKLLNCEFDGVFDQLDELLGHFLLKKRLRDFGVQEKELDGYVNTVETRQQRLTGNNYCPLEHDHMLKIFKNLY